MTATINPPTTASGIWFFRRNLVCFTANIPSANATQAIIAQKNAFLVAEESVEFKTIFRKKLGAGLFGGEGFILQKFQGEGLVFLEIDGEVLEYTLEPGEKMLIDQGT